ncbi:MAG TPA: pirin family protein [Burkholderiaceae bacterium]
MLELVITARAGDLGHGLVVRRVLPYAKRRMVGPFIFFDHAGPVAFAESDRRKVDVRPHPHIGLSTVSYLFSGEVMHRDSLGVEQAIRPGEVNWMTAGRGIAHSERFESAADFQTPGLELLQSWVALPEHAEECEPAFDNYPASVLPEQQRDGVWMRVIAGEAYGLSSPVVTHSPLFYVHTEMQAGASLGLDMPYTERAAYVVRGTLRHAGVDYVQGQMLVFAPGAVPAIEAATQATIMLLGGEPLGERHIWWNFVSSRKERIEQAKQDWLAGRILLPPSDNGEFIPLPTGP